jgi:hypothetical protein
LNNCLGGTDTTPTGSLHQLPHAKGRTAGEILPAWVEWDTVFGLVGEGTSGKDCCPPCLHEGQFPQDLGLFVWEVTRTKAQIQGALLEEGMAIHTIIVIFGGLGWLGP